MIKNKIYKFLEYLERFPDNYLLIGGTACEANLSDIGIQSRPTKDFDIVLCVENINSDFCKQLSKLIKDGNYKKGFSNKKCTAYRFINPLEKYPKQLELFASNKFGSLSLDKHLSRLKIEINDEEISTIVIDDELYEFIKLRHCVINGLSTVDRYGLILLKVVAYYKNKERYDMKKTNKSSEFKKHLEDIVLLLSSFIDSEIECVDNYPIKYKKYIYEFVEVLTTGQQIIINRRILNTNIKELVMRYKKIFDLTND